MFFLFFAFRVGSVRFRIRLHTKLRPTPYPETRTGKRNYFTAERNTRRNRKDEESSRGDPESAEKII